MPAATKYVTENSSSEARQLDEAFLRELRKRQKRHAAAWAYYEGDHREPLKADNTGTDDNLVINLIESVVDKGVSSLLGTDDQGMVKGLQFEVVDEPGEEGFVPRMFGRLRRAVSSEEPAPEQDYLDALWAANQQNILLADAFLSAAVTGHGFVKIVPDGKEGESGETLPRLVNLNPDNVTVFWADDDVERVLWYRIQFSKTRQDIVREVGEDGADSGQWLVYNYTRQTDHADWDLIGGEVRWPHSWPPVVDWKNRSNPRGYYGRSDVGTLGRLNDGLNFVASNTQRILKHHAHPKTIVVGVGAEQLERTAVDSLWAIGSASRDKVEVKNLEMASDLGSSLNFVTLIWRAIFDLGRELNPGTVADKLGDITNFGLRVLFSDSLAKSGMKRMLTGDALTRLNRRLLELANLNAKVKLNIIWPDPLPGDPLAMANALKVMSELGLSNETALERAGYDAEQEQQRQAVQRRETAATARIAQGAVQAAALGANGGNQPTATS